MIKDIFQKLFPKKSAYEDLSKLYPKWNCPKCKDWFHMPFKNCKCETVK